MIGLTPANGLAVDDTGGPKGLLAQLRATVQGKRFYRAQVKAVDRSIERCMSIIPTMDAARQKALEPQQRLASEFQTIREGLYAKYPQARPSPAQQWADGLKDTAERIEAQKNRMNLEVLLNGEVQRLLQIRNRLAARAQE